VKLYVYRCRCVQIMYIFVFHKVGSPLMTRPLGAIGVGTSSLLLPSHLHLHTGTVNNSVDIFVVV